LNAVGAAAPRAASAFGREIMMFRVSHSVIGALAVIATACSDNNNFAPFNSAAVRLVNDTDTPIVFTNGGIVDSTKVTVGFGESSGCVSVDLSNTRGLAVTNAATGESIAFAPQLTAGGNVIVVAFADAAGNIRFATLNDHFLPATNDAGLRFFNGAVSSTGPVVMQRNGAALTPFVDFGTSSNFVSVPIDSASITFADQFSIVLDAGRIAFPLGQNSTVVVGPPAPAATVPLRFFTVQGC
jgi:hypothetical protein